MEFLSILDGFLGPFWELFLMFFQILHSLADFTKSCCRPRKTMVFRGWACWKSWYFWCFWFTFSALIFRWFFDRFWSTFRVHFGTLCRSKIMFFEALFLYWFWEGFLIGFWCKKGPKSMPAEPQKSIIFLYFFEGWPQGLPRGDFYGFWKDLGWDFMDFWCILICFWLSFGMVLDKFPWFSWKALWSVLGIVQACGNHVSVQRIMASRAVLGYLAK